MIVTNMTGSALLGPGPVFSFIEGEAMELKPFKTYQEQVEILRGRGMRIGDASFAEEKLRTRNYYRLSGYWYPFRIMSTDRSHRLDKFCEGAAFSDVLALYDFDAELRAAVYHELALIESAIRALIGHSLGAVSPSCHTSAKLLGSTAWDSTRRRPDKKYLKWLEKYGKQVERSKREDFVKHHMSVYGKELPVWAAVEVMDWGLLSFLYGFAPQRSQTQIAGSVGLSGAQLGSWLKCLNVVRNVVAHHGRLYNRVFDIKPKLPNVSLRDEFAGVTPNRNRAFDQLTLIQYLLWKLRLGDGRLLPSVLLQFPDNPVVPITHTGAPRNWKACPLWRPGGFDA